MVSHSFPQLTSTVHEIEARQPAHLRDLLCSEVLFHSDGIVRPAFHSGIIRYQHAQHTFDAANASDNAPRGDRLVVQLMAS